MRIKIQIHHTLPLQPPPTTSSHRAHASSGRVPGHPFDQPRHESKIKHPPRGRRDADELHRARAPLPRFLAVTTLVATLPRGETPKGSFRPAVVLLSAEDVAARPLTASNPGRAFSRRSRKQQSLSSWREKALPSTRGKLSLSLSLSTDRPPRLACSPVPLVRQTTSSV